MKVLITCGPTWVPIDDVRVISNISSGVMGQTIAKEFKKNGAQVTLLEGAVTAPLKETGIKVVKFRFFSELSAIIKEQCPKKYDVIVHAAAVSDYQLSQAFKGKLDSKKTLRLDLVPTEKIIEKIKTFAPGACLVGFKLQPDLTRKNTPGFASPLIQGSGCDVVVVNSVNNGYQGFICDADQNILYETNSKFKLAKELVRILL